MPENKKIEILAPCGSPDALCAAVRQGADAVYIGLQKFSARAYADNFGGDELINSVRYCRLHGVKVHTAVNTLVSDDEIENALDAARKAYLAGVDAFIVQDWGLAALIKKVCPDAELHASTQMTVHTPEGARFLYNMGFDRVVLAREMSRDEIKQVVESVPVDTEVFVHGALCMCVSGQCYMSAMLGGRSGNRGRCAQPCRLPFYAEGGEKTLAHRTKRDNARRSAGGKDERHDLSLKDNSIINELGDLAAIGVTSAKIEGRMKRPEYVAAATAACRQAADLGKADDAALERLRAVFSRSGFTDGYYTAKRGSAMFGTRSKEDVTAATNKLLADIRNEYKDETQTNAAEIKLVLKADEPSKLTVVSRGESVTVTDNMPQQALKVALSAEKASSQLAKTGGTAFYAEKIVTEIGEGLTVPISQLNAMRRKAFDELTEKLGRPPVRDMISVEIPRPSPYRRKGELKIRAVFPDCDIPLSFKSCELLFVPLFSKTEDIGRLKNDGFNVGVKIPRVIFGREEDVKNALERVKAIGVSDVYCGNIGTAALAVRLGLNVHGGFSLNVFNTQSLAFIENMGLADTEVSIELTSRQINALGGSIKRGITGYGYLPLMITRNCPKRAAETNMPDRALCAACTGKGRITDRKGIDFTLMCDGICTELLNSEPLVLSDRLSEFGGADFITLSFTHESARDRERILELYRQRKKYGESLTRGLYFRGVE